MSVDTSSPEALGGPVGSVRLKTLPHRPRSLGGWVAAAIVYGVPTLVVLCPMLLFFVSSFWSIQDGALDRSFTLSNYEQFFADISYWGVYFATLRLSAYVGLFGLFSGYILAYLIWRQQGKLRYILLLFSVIPLAMNYIVKIFAMRNILGYNGLLNDALVFAGVLDHPSKMFVFNQTAVLISMCVIYLPFAILPIFLSLERIPSNLLAASADLGATGGQTFCRVIVPLSLPGSIVGALFVMVLALGDFLTPQMVGGSSGFTFGRAIWSQFGMAFNWPFGAALAVMLLVAIAAILLVARLLSAKGRTS